ncbi:hypothetical protein ACE1TI_03705 [Alteribacillus sp. JSM 102045]|uniref:hypothetical protein n=1 Tax=Alteribacillus sp. JSM 102045 TaxID=1562101 RepID=UPI0035BEFC30
MKTNRGHMSNELGIVLKESELEGFLLLFQNYLTRSSNKKYSLYFYQNVPLLKTKMDELSFEEKNLLKVKIDSFIAYLDNVNKIQFPSPFIIGVFTAVVSLVLGIMIRDPATFPNWAFLLVISCFVLVIPGISWLNLDQSVKNAEIKEVLIILKGILEMNG